MTLINIKEILKIIRRINVKRSHDLNRETNIVINLYAVEFYTYNFSIKVEDIDEDINMDYLEVESDLSKKRKFINIVDVKIYTCNDKVIEVTLTEKEFNDFENAMNTLFGKPVNHTFGQQKKD